MWKLLRNYFLTDDYSKSAKPGPHQPDVSAKSVSVKSSASIPGSESIRSNYYSLILGVHSLTDVKLNRFESETGKRVGKLIKSRESREKLVPRLPAVIPQLMGSLRNENSSGADLARLIGKDASLVAEAIRMANSPYYRTVNKIKSLEQAILILGHSGVRHLVASAAFKPLLNTRKGHFTNLASEWIWRQSEYCAFSAQCLAKKYSIDPFEAYLAGLVHEVGAIVVLRTMDRIENIDDAPRSYQFQQLFAKQSLRLSALIASEWEFPANVIQALDDQTTKADPAQMSVPGSVLHTAALMSQLKTLIDDGRIENNPAQFDRRIEECFEKLQRYTS
jgi:HD-like signal output (HDOD) protein